MGLAGFNRARRRHQEDGVEAIYASAPPKQELGSKYVKQDITQKQYCAYCDKHFNNQSAYEMHMKLKHPVDWIENNPGKPIPKIVQNNLDKLNKE